MWLASHMMSGGLIYDSTRDEPRKFKWPLFMGAAVVFHWVLDSTPVFHDMDWPWQWWQWLIALWNALVVFFFLWQLERPRPWGRWLKKIFLKRLFVGGFAWLCLDAFWLYRPWGSSLHNIFPNIGRWSEPTSSILELLFMGLLSLLAWKQIESRRRRRQTVMASLQ